MSENKSATTSIKNQSKIDTAQRSIAISDGQCDRLKPDMIERERKSKSKQEKYNGILIVFKWLFTMWSLFVDNRITVMR